MSIITANYRKSCISLDELRLLVAEHNPQESIYIYTADQGGNGTSGMVNVRFDHPNGLIMSVGYLCDVIDGEVAEAGQPTDYYTLDRTTRQQPNGGWVHKQRETFGGLLNELELVSA